MRRISVNVSRLLPSFFLRGLVFGRGGWYTIVVKEAEKGLKARNGRVGRVQLFAANRGG